ncbi:FG-GAP-like repeat-containing protein [Mucilaginibacter puniceus]
MKRLLLLIIILFSALTSFAQEAVPVDSLKKDTAKNVVILTDTLKYTPRDPKNPQKAIVKITPGINEVESSENKTVAKSASRSMSMSASTDAGRTATAIDVSPSGAATYSVPIAVPPGISGVVPRIALVYNSQAGNGLAGYGWNISGLSSITRIAPTIFHDDTVGGVKGNIHDRYALDGQRLLLKSGTYGADGAEYQTENYSNTKIVSHGSLGTGPGGIALGPQYFDVYYTDGSHAVYGQDTTSRTKTSYGINYMDNPQNIRISYVYTKAYEVSLISQIAFGALSSGTAINQINFSYNSRNRNEQMYVGGTPIFQQQILSQIDVVGNGSGYRTYALTQDTVAGLKYEQVSSIQELSGDGSKSFEPIYFYYGYNYSSITVTESTDPFLSGVTATNSKVLTGDFNGNGKMDVVVYPNAKNKFWIKWDPNQNPSPGFTDPVNLSFVDMFASTYLKANNKVATGQGLVLVQQPAADTIKFRTFSEGIFYAMEQEYVRELTIPVPPVMSTSPCNTFDFTPDSKITQEYYSGDFNGDGLTDVIAIDKGYFYKGSSGCSVLNNDANASFINLDRRITSNFVHSLGSLKTKFGWNGRTIYTADFNGDGKTDLVRVIAGKMEVYSLNASNELILLWSHTDSSIHLYFPPLLGDFNGDGKSDIMFPSPIWNLPNTFGLFTSTGTGFSKQDKTYPFANAYNTLIPTDVNGDGKTDIISYSTQTNNTHWGLADVKMYISTGSTTSGGATEFELGPSQGRYAHLDNYPIPLFLNNNEPNHDLEFGLLSDNSITQFSSDQDMRNIRQLKTVAHDGVIHYIDYKVAMKDDGYPLPIYDADEKQVYPYVNMVHAPGIRVASKLRRVVGTADVMQVFNYRSAVSNMVGLGYLGFGETVRSSWMANGTSYDPNTIFTTNLYDPLLRGAMIRSFTSKAPFEPENINIKNKPGTTPDTTLATAVTTAKTVVAARSIRLLPGFSASGANGTFIAKLDDPVNGIADGSNIDVYITRTDYTYNTQLLSSKVFINKPTAVITKDLLNKTNTITSYGYDSYYNVNHQESIFSGHGTRTAHYEFDNNTSSWYFGRLTNKKETSTIGGDSFSTEEQYTYNGAFVEQIKRKGNGTPFITEDYVPDAFGNVKQKTVTTGDGARVIKTDYDASGRFIAKLTEVNGQETNMAYNSSNGTLSSLTNPYGQTTSYTYDAWGREIKAIDYKGNETDTYYNGNGSGGISITKENDEGEYTGTSTNALGQITFVLAKDVLGQYVGIEYQYDIYGRQISQSEPGIGSYSQVNTTEYDDYGRIATMTSYTGKTTTMSYNGLQTTVNDGTKSVTNTRDAMGNIKTVQDPGGTINYTYFGNGGLKSTDYGGSGQTIEQDGWGRKTKLTDPSAGVYMYTYNQFGEPLTEVTPKGTTTYTYLADGRINSKDITGDHTDMEYAYSYNSDKLLTTVGLTDNTYHNNINYTYGYDTDKRLESIIEDNPQARFTKTLGYDGFNRVLTEANEAKNKSNNLMVSKTITNVYAHGQVEEITVGGNSIWKVTDQDARGHVTTALLGTALKQTNTYDSYGLPQNFTTQKLVPGNPPVSLLELGFSFNTTTGNLTSRTNSAFNPTPGNPWSESFTYDTQDRLTQYDENSTTTNHTQSYDARGRITNNGQVGNYTYSGTSYQQSGLTNLTAFAKYHYQPSQKRQLQQIAYNAFKAPVTINEEGRERIDFEYNGAEQRSHMYYGDTTTTKTARPFVRHYSEDGSMEITEDKVSGKTGFIFYLGGDAYTAPAIWKYEKTGSTVNTDNLYYLLRDHLSSIVMITNDTGRVEEKRHFDAWGNIIKIEDGAGTPLNVLTILDRGYTGHEHLQGVGLINMNARLYDPVLHRFLAPDGLIQDPYNTQDYNRYAYVLNNPLKYIDPSGNKREETEEERKAREAYEAETERILEELRRNNPNTLPDATVHGTPGNNWGSGGGGGCCGFNFDNNSSVDAMPIPFMPVTYNGGTLNEVQIKSPRTHNNQGNVLVNPSGGALRGQDLYGNGHFGASRDGGTRLHLGIDIITVIGQPIVSPISGKAVNYRGATSGKPMVDIIPFDRSRGIDKIRILYVNSRPGVVLLSPYNVKAGQVIGTAANLGDLGYPKNIIPHVHTQIWQNGRWIDPTPYFFNK